VYNETSNLSKNFDETISQLIKTKNFWARFHLSLPGRIAVAKTLMLSKLSYLGCILNPDPDQLLEINNIITSFVKGKMNVAHEKIMAPVEIGGLGMINLNDFLKCIKLAWIKRAKSIDDNWATAVVNIGLDKPDFYSNQNPDAIKQPIINNIYTAFCEFRSSAVLYKKNILLSPVVDNPVLIEKGVESIKINDVPVHLLDRFRELTFSDLIVNGSPFTRARIAAEFNGLPEEVQERIYKSLRFVTRFLRADLDPDPVDPPKKVSDIIFKNKKGSKTFRKYLTARVFGEKILNNSSLKKFFESVGLPAPDPASARRINCYWKTSFFPNKFKEFLFKLYNNQIGLNSRIAHFNRLVNPECTFCLKRKLLPAQRETLKHLFIDCPEVTPVFCNFFSSINAITGNIDDDEKINLWMCGGFNTKNGNDNTILNIVSKLSLFYIWENKLKKSFLSTASYYTFIREYMLLFCNLNTNLNICMTNASLIIRRCWHG
jgi:hypothetical protein